MAAGLDIHRIDALRRRIDKDPASIAFAQLAEELRRAGQIQESIETCRAGLAIHPTYLSARVTLGRALLEANDLEAARREMEMVLAAAADNLAAMRALGEIHHRCGALEASLERYQTALELAPNDPDLEEAVASVTRELAERAQPDSEPLEAAEGPVAVSCVSEPDEFEDDAVARAVAQLENWLDAIHVARAVGRA
jgi:tetratricopeptide (TPR) repeat protein